MDDIGYLVAKRRIGRLFVTARLANKPGERLWWLIDDAGIRHTSWIGIGSIDNGTAKGIKIVILSFALMIGWNASYLK